MIKAVRNGVMTVFRRYARLAWIVAFAFAAANAAAQERDYPNRPVRLVVGFLPGGTTDFMARLLADRLRGPLGQSVIVENRTGANGAIGAEYVARSEPDGYTLYFTTAGVAAVYPHLRPAPYDPLRDFAPVSLVAFNSTMLVVNAGLPVKSAVDLAALARERPGEITLAITALGSVSHLGLVLFQSAAGVQFQQIPYRGAAPAMTDPLGGTLNGLFGDGPTVIEHVRARSIKPLATTSKQRSDIFPDVPTFVEQGFADTVADQWAGVLAPARTPAEIIRKLNAAIAVVLNDADVRAKLRETGTTPAPGPADDFGRYLREEHARWGRIVREKNIRAE
jgi:tripartite-type tricarboxylate transporter receptor subunit TctC